MTTRFFCGVATLVAIVASPPPVSAQAARTVAIVPFENLAAAPDDDWIGIGVAETLATDLRGAWGISVLSRAVVDGAVRNVAGSGRSTDERVLLATAREVGADLLIAGASRQGGRELELTARLIDVQSESTVEAFRVKGRPADLFTLQDRLAGEVRAALRRLVPEAGLGRPRGTATGNGNGGGNGGPDGAEADPAVVAAAGDAPVAAIAGRRPRGAGSAFGARPRAGESATAVSGGFGAAGVQVAGVPGPTPPPNPTPAAQTGPGAGFALPARPFVRARRTDEPPSIDGRLDDAVWRSATLVSDFIQTNPVEGAAPTERTEVRIAYDADHLYFAFYAYYADPTQMRANRVDRDQAWRDDWIAVVFDTFLDQQRAYRFSVNPYGVQGDAILRGGRRRFGPVGGSGDWSWDALFESGGRIVDDGWTAEMAIPFKSLRYPSRGEGEHRWGFQISRTLQTKDETVVWSPVTRRIAGELTQMGTLGGLRGLSASRNLEVLPTATAIQVGRLTDGGYVDDAAQPDFGVNVKYGVTSNLTADFTLNPDFSQIESDRPQIETNQRFPLFFPELRPFFLEGQEIFRTPGRTTLLHTKTIVDPQVGGKLTGKVGNTTLGVLLANDAAPGKFDDPQEYGFGRTAQFVVGRARYDMYSESYVGALVTDREFLDSFSRVAAVDGRFRIGQTHSAAFLAATSANRELDGAVRNGPLYDLQFRRDSRHLNYRLQYHEIDPEFGTAAGFVRRVDMRRFDADVEYVWWPESWIISWGPGFRYSRNVDHADVLQDEEFRGDVNVRFARNVFFRADGRRELERFNGIDFHKTRFSLRNGIQSSRRVSVFYGIDWGEQIRFIDSPFLGRMFDYNVNLTLRPTSRLSTQFRLDTARFTDAGTGALEFDVKLLRTYTTYQFTDRLLIRNILEHDTGNGKVGINLLVTYRVNAGTVFYAGFDDRLQQGIYLDREQFDNRDLQRHQRAFFTKLQYLFRY
ncbi:MAG: DUF5916 domain-containing protein [Acidobacteria bacterium]|nr:DUF5916 domain-containing protein [Acidobacteriota bacterium]